ncbi:MAG: helix-hairpin-helix domain-containing protein [Clostridia bacterium]|nr:helix-hairpin-helix domain-containing protein [Clostridia bacterium]
MERFLSLFDSNPKLKRLLIDNWDYVKKIGIIAALALGVFVVFMVTGDKDVNPVTKEANAKTISADEVKLAKIYVDIGGEVVNPMLAELSEGSRVEDAIQAAGGLTEDADLTSINRAEFLEDGEKIFIPARIEGDSVVDVAGTTTLVGGKVNINTADSTALQTLNGVGPATAQKIIDYRTSSGRFKTIDDLKNVSGIGDKTFEKLKDYITV